VTQCPSIFLCATTADHWPLRSYSVFQITIVICEVVRKVWHKFCAEEVVDNMHLISEGKSTIVIFWNSLMWLFYVENGW
jgi:hypothetical protein